MSRRESLEYEICQHGFAVLDEAVPESAIDAVTAALECVQHTGAIRRRGSAHAVRNLPEAVPEVQTAARSEPIRAIVERVLGPSAFAVRGILFDKTPTANWKVAWHQGLTIAVCEPQDAPGFGPWSMKAGIPHVQPPTEVLERMLTVRINLDACGPENGPLRVIPGSHRGGRLNAGDIAQWRETTAAVACTAARVVWSPCAR